MLEGSNVKPVIEMARMIEVHRAYDAVKGFVEDHNFLIALNYHSYGNLLIFVGKVAP